MCLLWKHTLSPQEVYIHQQFYLFGDNATYWTESKQHVGEYTMKDLLKDWNGLVEFYFWFLI